MPETSLCEMHDRLSQFFEEWGDVHITSILKFIAAAVTLTVTSAEAQA